MANKKQEMEKWHKGDWEDAFLLTKEETSIMDAQE
jgi:hypothetical protein